MEIFWKILTLEVMCAVPPPETELKPFLSFHLIILNGIFLGLLLEQMIKKKKKNDKNPVKHMIEFFLRKK